MIKNYFKVALRNIFRQKAYAFINISGLAIGICCCLLIISYVQDELSYDNFHPEVESTYRIALDRKFPDNRFGYARSPMPMGPTLAQDIPEVTAASRMFNNFGALTFHHEDRYFDERNVIAVDSNFFDFFGVELLEGDPKKALSEPNALVITQEMATKYFGNQTAMGQQLEIENVGQMMVRGIAANMPANAHFRFDFLFSLSTNRALYNNQFWGGYIAYNYVKMDPYTLPVVEGKLEPLLQQYMAPQIQSVLGISWQQYLDAGNSHRYYFQPIRDIHLKSHLQWELMPNGNQSTVYLFAGISAFILLIACINFINLSTARSANRAKEVGMRKVLGAVKRQLVIQFLTESVLMCVLALILALGLTALILPLFNELSGKVLSFTTFFNPVILLLLFAGALMLGAIAGMYPAFFLSAFKPVSVLKGKLKAGAKNSWLRNGLVIFQFGISVVLVIGTVIIYQQLQYLNSKQLGFDKDQLLVIERAAQLNNQSLTFKNALLESNDITHITGMNTIPGRQINGGTFTDVTGDASDRFLMPNLTGDYDLIQTMGLEVIEGRSFDSNIVTDSTAVIINEAAARTFKWADPIGKQLQPINGPIFRVIGVVKDFHVESLHEEIRPLALFARRLDAQPSNLLVLKINTESISETLALIDKKWSEFVPARPLAYRFVNEEFGALYEAEQQSGRIFSAFSGLAIFIACLGAFGLAAFLATQRVKEIGVRKVLGASTASIVALLSKDFIKLILIANLLAWPLAYLGMQRWLENFAYAVGVSWTTFIVVALGSVMIALLTVSYHSIRAAISNPADTLHHE